MLNKCHANIVSIEHNKYRNVSRYTEVEIRITCETNGESHIEFIDEEFAKAGYHITRIK